MALELEVQPQKQQELTNWCTVQPKGKLQLANAERSTGAVINSDRSQFVL